MNDKVIIDRHRLLALEEIERYSESEDTIRVSHEYGYSYYTIHEALSEITKSNAKIAKIHNDFVHASNLKYNTLKLGYQNKRDECENYKFMFRIFLFLFLLVLSWGILSNFI